MGKLHTCAMSTHAVHKWVRVESSSAADMACTGRLLFPAAEVSVIWSITAAEARTCLELLLSLVHTMQLQKQLHAECLPVGSRHILSLCARAAAASARSLQLSCTHVSRLELPWQALRAAAMSPSHARMVPATSIVAGFL